MHLNLGYTAHIKGLQFDLDQKQKQILNITPATFQIQFNTTYRQSDNLETGPRTSLVFLHIFFWFLRLLI